MTILAPVAVAPLLNYLSGIMGDERLSFFKI